MLLFQRNACDLFDACGEMVCWETKVHLQSTMLAAVDWIVDILFHKLIRLFFI